MPISVIPEEDEPTKFDVFLAVIYLSLLVVGGLIAILVISYLEESNVLQSAGTLIGIVGVVLLLSFITTRIFFVNPVLREYGENYVEFTEDEFSEDKDDQTGVRVSPESIHKMLNADPPGSQDPESDRDEDLGR